MNDDGGVLGRLPRSRPGTRSEKRADAEAAAPKPSSKAKPKATAAKTAKPKTANPKTAKPKAATPKPPPSRPMPREPRRERPPHATPPAQERAGDPLTEALRTGAKVAEGGVRLAGGITRELLRRIPRP